MSKVTQALIDAAAQKHGEVFILEVSSGSIELAAASNEKEIEVSEEEFQPEPGYAYAVVHRPDKRTLGFALTQKDPIQVGNALLKNCIVELEKGVPVADDAILQDEQTNISAALEVVQLVEIRAAKLKKYSRVFRPSKTGTPTVSAGSQPGSDISSE